MHWIDPAQLPVFKGTIERFTVNGQGELDGFLLDTGADGVKLIHFPSHMAIDVQSALKRGDQVGVRGLKPRDAAVIAVISLECANGMEILDHGPPKYQRNDKDSPLKQVPMSATGRVRLTLFTPKGKARGAILDDGTILRLTLKGAEEIRERLTPGAMIEIRGMGLETQHGRVIDAHYVATLAPAFEVVIKPKGLSADAGGTAGRS
jgi:hypothetical protein